MQSKFGLKDFVLFVLVGLVGLSVWFSLIQQDRVFNRVRTVEAAVGGVESQVTSLERQLRRGGVASGESQQERHQPVVVNVFTGPGGAQVGEQHSGVGVTPWQQPQQQAGQQPQQQTGQQPTATASRDGSWAREGVKIQWQERDDFVNDPADHEAFRMGGELGEIYTTRWAKVMPFVAQDVYSRYITDHIFDVLARVDPETLDNRGVLAEAWQYDPDGMWLRVKLWEDARFSDGVPVTAADVEFTWNEIIKNPQIEADRVRSITDGITSIRALSEHVVEFEFREALYSNEGAALAQYVLPKHFYERFTPSQFNQATSLLLGSGAFRLEVVDPDNQWRPGSDFVLVRNEAYWGPALPPVARLRFKSINDPTAALVAYTNEEAHILRATSEQFVSHRDREDWKARHHSLEWLNMRSGYAFIAWQCGKRRGERLTPFHDQRVRLAMTHMLDRERMIQDIRAGIGEVATGPQTNASPVRNPDIEPWPYDLDRARQLLAEAGWTRRPGQTLLTNEAGDQFVFELAYPSGSEAYERLVNYVRNQGARLGIRVEPRPFEWSIVTQILNNRDFDAISFAWSASGPESDQRQIYHSASIEDQGDNFIQWANEEADYFIDKARRTLDFDERMKVWHEFHRVVHEEQPYTFLFSPPWTYFVNKKFKNVHTYPSGFEVREFFFSPDPGF